MSDDQSRRPPPSGPSSRGRGRGRGEGGGQGAGSGGGRYGRPNSGSDSRPVRGGDSRASGDKPRYGSTTGSGGGRSDNRTARSGDAGRSGKPGERSSADGKPRYGKPSGGSASRSQRDGGRPTGEQRYGRSDGGGSASGRPALAGGGRSGPPRPGIGRSNASVPRAGGGRSEGGERWVRPEPTTDAERRAAEVRSTRGPRRTEVTEDTIREKIESRETEEWIDEGSIRDAAERAVARGSQTAAPRRPQEIDPEVVAEIHGVVDTKRATRLSERLAAAAGALDRERFDDARRMVTPLVRELPTVAAVHEISGLANYRMGRWKQAAASLEIARALRPDPAMLPVLADCYRALKRWPEVDRAWKHLRDASPSHEVMAEGRIVMAGALADRGELKQAITLMHGAQKSPKKVRDHNLRQWYVLADLYDRAGDTVTAARWFREISAHDANFVDVRERLRSIGR